MFVAVTLRPLLLLRGVASSGMYSTKTLTNSSLPQLQVQSPKNRCAYIDTNQRVFNLRNDDVAKSRPEQSSLLA